MQSDYLLKETYCIQKYTHNVSINPFLFAVTVDLLFLLQICPVYLLYLCIILWINNYCRLIMGFVGNLSLFAAKKKEFCKSIKN